VNEEEASFNVEVALARVDSHVQVITDFISPDAIPQFYYRGDANQRLQLGTIDDAIDVDWQNTVGQGQDYLWRRFHELTDLDRQHIINYGLDFQLDPRLEAQIHRQAPGASLLELFAEPIIVAEHLDHQERRRWQQYLGGDIVGDHPVDDGNPRIGLSFDSSSTSTYSSISSMSDSEDSNISL
jgi:hypothetical protein